MPSLWGKGTWGTGLYSLAPAGPVNLAGNLAPSVTYHADLTIVGKVDFVGNLTPSVAFAGNLLVSDSLVGNLAPSVTLHGDLAVTRPLAGDLSFQPALNSPLMLISAVEGNIYFSVTLACVEDMWVGPLWEMTTPCGPVDWEMAEVCNG